MDNLILRNIEAAHHYLRGIRKLGDVRAEYGMVIDPSGHVFLVRVERRLFERIAECINEQHLAFEEIRTALEGDDGYAQAVKRIAPKKRRNKGARPEEGTEDGAP